MAPGTGSVQGRAGRDPLLFDSPAKNKDNEGARRTSLAHSLTRPSAAEALLRHADADATARR